MTAALSRSLRSRAARALCAALAPAALAVAAPVSAGPLVSASFGFQLGTLPGATFPGVGATGTATSNLGASLDAGTAFAGTLTTSIPTSAAPPITGIEYVVSVNGAGTFAGATPGQVGGELLFEGVVNVDGIGGVPNGGTPLLVVPLKLGVPHTVFEASGGVALTAISAGWTAGTASVPLPTLATTATAMGANALTPGGAGTLVLVTPLVLLTNVAGRIASFGTLTLSYVPEPGTLLLFGLGVAVLGALGRRRL